MHAETLETIREAIRKRRQLVFMYDGYPRDFCPHAIGTKRDEWHVFGWQFGGDSSHGLDPNGQNWRCLNVDRIQSLSVSDGEWHRGWTKGMKPSSCIDVMDTVVDPAFAAVDRQTLLERIR